MHHHLRVLARGLWDQICSSTLLSLLFWLAVKLCSGVGYVLHIVSLMMAATMAAIHNGFLQMHRAENFVAKNGIHAVIQSCSTIIFFWIRMFPQVMNRGIVHHHHVFFFFFGLFCLFVFVDL